MPIFEPYISFYIHIFGQNARKFLFLYPTKLVAYEYVKKIMKKSPNFFWDEESQFFGIGAPMPIFEP